MTQDGAAGAGLHDVAVFFEPHSAKLKIKLVDALGRVAEDDASGGCVVGDGIAEFGFPTLDSAIDDLQRRHDKAGRGQNLRWRNSRSLQLALENKRDLRFDLRLDQ